MIKIIDLNSRYGRYAIRLSLSCFFVVVFYKFFHIEHGYWAAFSVIACVVPTAGQSLERSRQRILGTFIGMILGIVVAHTFGKNMLGISILIAVFVFLTVYLKTLSYSYYVTFNTVIAVLFVCLIIPGDWQAAIVRLEMTIFGVAIAICATYFILPITVSTEIPLQLEELRSKLQKYYLFICQEFLDLEHGSLQLSRQETFSIMQNTAAIIKESNLESWGKDSRYQYYADIYTNLEKIYQILLILETDIPTNLKEAELQCFINPIRNVLSNISPLFNQKTIFKETQLSIDLNQKELQRLLTELQKLRIKAVSNIALPIATFKEHIQLTATLNNLNNLIIALKNAIIIINKLNKL